VGKSTPNPDRGTTFTFKSNLEGEFDANQMHQALLNMVLNAIDACHSGDLG